MILLLTWQAKRAAELLAVAQQKALVEERPPKRKKRMGLRSYVGPPSHVLLGARISVFWPDDNAFYKACLPSEDLACPCRPCARASDFSCLSCSPL